MVETGANVTEMAKRHEVTPSYVTWVIRLNFLAPPIVQKIATGTAPARIDAKILLGLGDLPLDWSAQEKLLLAG